MEVCGIEVLMGIVPLVIALIIYIIKIERRLGVLITDISWIKEILHQHIDPNGKKDKKRANDPRTPVSV